MIILLVLVGWLACSILSFGLAFAFFQGEWKQFAWRDRRTDAGFATLISVVGGPLALFLVFMLSGFGQHGLRFRSVSPDESWDEYHRRYPSLNREDWLS